MGIRTYNRCLTITVLTILILLVTHVAILIWYITNSYEDVAGPLKPMTPRTPINPKRNHHPRKKYIKNIPTPININGMNCTTTSLGGLNCDHERAKSNTNQSYVEPPVMYFYNDEVHYYTSSVRICLSYISLLCIINLL